MVEAISFFPDDTDPTIGEPPLQALQERMNDLVGQLPHDLAGNVAILAELVPQAEVKFQDQVANTAIAEVEQQWSPRALKKGVMADFYRTWKQAKQAASLIEREVIESLSKKSTLTVTPELRRERITNKTRGRLRPEIKRRGQETEKDIIEGLSSGRTLDYRTSKQMRWYPGEAQVAVLPGDIRETTDSLASSHFTETLDRLVGQLETQVTNQSPTRWLQIGISSIQGLLREGSLPKDQRGALQTKITRTLDQAGLLPKSGKEAKEIVRAGSRKLHEGPLKNWLEETVGPDTGGKHTKTAEGSNTEPGIRPGSLTDKLGFVAVGLKREGVSPGRIYDVLYAMLDGEITDRPGEHPDAEIGQALRLLSIIAGIPSDAAHSEQ